MNFKIRTFVVYTFWSILFISGKGLAQSTPAEFAELSLQELFEPSIENDPEQASGWRFNYQFKTVEFDGYLQDDSSLTLDEVLWEGPSETRTTSNFPVVPTIIKQRAHVLSIGYQYDEALAFHLATPYIEQETDHISIVPGYSEFLIKTQGVGDTVLSTSYKFINTERHNWWASVGISLPTGSIDEVGDTPRAPGDQQLPYTMQLGSGTFDIPLELNYQSGSEHDFSVNISAMIRTGSNDRDYRLGNNYSLGGRYRYAFSEAFSGFVGMDFQYSQSVRGRDESLIVDAPIPYPASITNPALYGGRKLSFRAGLSWSFADTFRLTLEAGKPVYQHLNGPQPKETWRTAIQLAKAI